ncbi:hypothetical protein Pcinc_033317 [Petrolisthes cinctipes]|uniref:Uncharacterized protein n=1 Tax=Petrolisthes cinctipes TaxID=88211 RepID=A0AAE1ESK2_PETCI|nr:hypothetical protein Pcinc_033317 [Petrolisthes cinctipes]
MDGMGVGRDGMGVGRDGMGVGGDGMDGTSVGGVGMDGTGVGGDGMDGCGWGWDGWVWVGMGRVLEEIGWMGWVCEGVGGTGVGGDRMDGTSEGVCGCGCNNPPVCLPARSTPTKDNSISSLPTTYPPTYLAGVSRPSLSTGWIFCLGDVRRLELLPLLG